MTIKPGSLCLIVKANSHPDWVGKIVTAIGYHPAAFLFHGAEPSLESGVWEIDAEWLPPPPDGLPGWAAPASYLRPINDPDADTTETDDALMDNLLDALQYTKEAA